MIHVRCLIYLASRCPKVTYDSLYALFLLIYKLQTSKVL